MVIYLSAEPWSCRLVCEREILPRHELTIANVGTRPLCDSFTTVTGRFWVQSASVGTLGGGGIFYPADLYARFTGVRNQIQINAINWQEIKANVKGTRITITMLEKEKFSHRTTSAKSPGSFLSFLVTSCVAYLMRHLTMLVGIYSWSGLETSYSEFPKVCRRLITVVIRFVKATDTLVGLVFYSIRNALYNRHSHEAACLVWLWQERNALKKIHKETRGHTLELVLVLD